MPQSPIDFVLPEAVTLGAAPTLLAVPYLSQPVTNWCWATCATMLARFHGHAIRICEATSKLIPNEGCCEGVPPEGTFNRSWSKGTCNRTCTVDEINKLHVAIGLKSKRCSGQVSFAELERELSTSGRPVEVAYAWTGGGGHVAVVRGIDHDKQMVHVNDPWPDYGQTVVQFEALRSAYGKGAWFETWTDIAVAED